MSHNDIIGKAMTKVKFNFSMNHVIGFSMESLMKFEEGQSLSYESLKIIETLTSFQITLNTFILQWMGRYIIMAPSFMA